MIKATRNRILTAAVFAAAAASVFAPARQKLEEVKDTSAMWGIATSEAGNCAESMVARAYFENAVIKLPDCAEKTIKLVDGAMVKITFDVSPEITGTANGYYHFGPAHDRNDALDQLPYGTSVKAVATAGDKTVTSEVFPLRSTKAWCSDNRRLVCTP